MVAKYRNTLSGVENWRMRFSYSIICGRQASRHPMRTVRDGYGRKPKQRGDSSPPRTHTQTNCISVLFFFRCDYMECVMQIVNPIFWGCTTVWGLEECRCEQTTCLLIDRVQKAKLKCIGQFLGHPRDHNQYKKQGPKQTKPNKTKKPRANNDKSIILYPQAVSCRA